jgi:hypothetical protein
MNRNFLILILGLFYSNLIFGQTSGTLSVSVSTKSAGGNYSPKNVMAVWIENNSGKFIKTLLVYGDKRKTHLNVWESSTSLAGSTFNSVDAITGATQTNHGLRNCNWDGTDFSRLSVPDGDYKLRMELTDKNETGNVASLNFTKGPKPYKLNSSTIPGFSTVSINWSVKDFTPRQERVSSIDTVVSPNPGSGKFTIITKNVVSLKVTSLTGRVICISETPTFDLTDQPNGIYFVTIKTNQESIVRKVIKN